MAGRHIAIGAGRGDRRPTRLGKRSGDFGACLIASFWQLGQRLRQLGQIVIDHEILASIRLVNRATSNGRRPHTVRAGNNKSYVR
jgi:hypothetical protein